MSGGTRMSLITAQRVAEEISGLLSPVCQRLVIAGSIRRERATVGDIELVIEPTYSTVEQRINLFDTVPVQTCELESKVLALVNAGLLRPRYKEDGSVIAYPKEFKAESRYLSLWYGADEAEQVKLDLFISRPKTLVWWGWLLFLRTGPGDCNRLMVSRPNQSLLFEIPDPDKPGKTKLEWFNGLLPRGVVVGGKGYEGMVYKYGGVPMPMETEQAVFESWGLDYLAPCARTPVNYRDAKRK
jgi:hypothetical protein